jgi:3-isopropylmalate dehydrogenase
MKQVLVPLTKGDGEAPAMMDVVCPLAIQAAEMNDIELVFVDAPGGYAALASMRDTYPASTRELYLKHKIAFFGGVGEKALDETIGKERPHMKPEGRLLLGARQDLELLVCIRPLTIPTFMANSARVKHQFIPRGGINAVCMRYLPEDGYYGNRDLIQRLRNLVVSGVPHDDVTIVVNAVIAELGLRQKGDVTGEEKIVTDMAYFTRKNLERFARYAFSYAREHHRPVLDIHKANILPTSIFWKMTMDRIRKEEFPDVEFLGDEFIDAACSKVYNPAIFNAVIIAANVFGDIFSDALLGALSMGMMHSISINPDTGAAFFESGAGTADDIKGQDIANPLGRALTAALLLKHIGAHRGGQALEDAIWKVLKLGWRTRDIYAEGVDKPSRLIGTREMGKRVARALSCSRML